MSILKETQIHVFYYPNAHCPTVCAIQCRGREQAAARGGLVAGTAWRLLPSSQRLPEAPPGDTEPVLRQDRDRRRGQSESHAYHFECKKEILYFTIVL